MDEECDLPAVLGSVDLLHELNLLAAAPAPFVRMRITTDASVAMMAYHRVFHENTFFSINQGQRQPQRL